MSVGGRVVETIDCGDRVWINTRERYWNGQTWKEGEECAIYVERTERSLSVQPLDNVWWQGRKAYWTPRGEEGPGDHPIARIGYSGVSRPAHG